MTFSGIHLHYALNDILPLLPAYLQKLKQLKKGQWLLTFKGKQKFQIYLSIHSQDARMHRTNESFDYSEALDNFTTRMKKWLLNSTLISGSQPGLDRTIQLIFKGKDELFNPKTYIVMAEFFGKDANLVITDDYFKILDLFKTSGSLHENQRLLQMGATYEFLPTSKKSPFDEKAVSDYFKLTEKPPITHLFNGFSKAVAESFIEGLKTKEDWFNRLNHPRFMVHKNENTLFYKKDESLSFVDFADLLLTQTLNQRPYDTTKSKALKALSNKLKKVKKKEALLKSDLQKTSESTWYSDQGKLIMQEASKHAKKDSIEVFDYTDNTLKTIPLDIRYTVLENANRLFKKAKKMKASIPHIKKQLKLTKLDIDYYELLITQITEADEMSLQDIYIELVKEKIIQVKSASLVKKKAKYKTYISSDKTEILVGMNNIQNNELTHKIARNHDYFCHVKDYPGSHVIIKDPSPTKATLKEACMLAAYYSKAKHSPKVEVDIVKVKDVKKIPGKYGCFVRYDHHESYFVEATLPPCEEKK